LKKILVIQTAFIGDVILATAAIESIHDSKAYDQIDVLVRKGNESLLADHPFINKVYVWDKKQGKYKALMRLSKEVRKQQYDVVINLQRYASSGWLSFRSKAKIVAGFKNNPLSFLFTHKVMHEIGNGTHEVDRNQQLLNEVGEFVKHAPKLYPTESDFRAVRQYSQSEFIVMAPSSVWFTKQLPKNKWVELIDQLQHKQVYLIGAPSDEKYLEEIKTASAHQNCQNLAGELSLLQSAALIKNAEMTYVNDSAPLHLASSMNARVTAFFCSTVPDFGFGPLSDESFIIQSSHDLECRPCGLHGKSSCPKGHFDCGATIDVTIEAK